MSNQTVLVTILATLIGAIGFVAGGIFAQDNSDKIGRYSGGISRSNEASTIWIFDSLTGTMCYYPGNSHSRFAELFAVRRFQYPNMEIDDSTMHDILIENTTEQEIQRAIGQHLQRVYREKLEKEREQTP